VTESDDLTLAGRLVRDGDPAAFHALYARHTPMLYALARRLLGDDADAEDAVHDSWVRAVEGLHRFRGASSLRTWLTGVLLNRVRELGRLRRHVGLDDVGEEGVATDEVVTLSHDVDPIDLERALSALPPGYREVVLLHDVEGYTHEEIGRLLDVEPGTSKSQLARGRKRLRRILQETREAIDG
jgi:RNA polymerase sigma-70 factor (ECF subfamily)